jgi:hypothetical protein
MPGDGPLVGLHWKDLVLAGELFDRLQLLHCCGQVSRGNSECHTLPHEFQLVAQRGVSDICREQMLLPFKIFVSLMRGVLMLRVIEHHLKFGIG